VLGLEVVLECNIGAHGLEPLFLVVGERQDTRDESHDTILNVNHVLEEFMDVVEVVTIVHFEQEEEILELVDGGILLLDKITDEDNRVVVRLLEVNVAVM